MTDWIFDWKPLSLCSIPRSLSAEFAGRILLGQYIQAAREEPSEKAALPSPSAFAVVLQSLLALRSFFDSTAAATAASMCSLIPDRTVAPARPAATRVAACTARLATENVGGSGVGSWLEAAVRGARGGDTTRSTALPHASSETATRDS